MTIEVQGRTVSYIDTDPTNDNNRPVVLFLHGWGAPAETYRLMIDHLAAYCRVVAPDLPGFGGSAEPETPWCVDDYVAWTVDFAAALGLVGLFCCVTNSPISAILLSVEMFGSANLSTFAFVCVIVFVLSGNWGLYSSQIIQFSKARLVRKDHNGNK